MLARYSEGLRLATRHGSGSGILLEYAYENVPQGSGALGRWIDRTFLHLARCDTMRQQVDRTRELIAGLVAERRAQGRKTVILDVAAGTARYLREVARTTERGQLVIRCLDRNPHEVMLGRQLVNREALSEFLFEVGDATDDASYLMSEDPDIVLAVDLFPYLHNDCDVTQVMGHAFAHLADGGIFVCTDSGPHDTGSATWGGNGFQLEPKVRDEVRLERWLAAAGFVDVTRTSLGEGRTALVGKKPLASRTPQRAAASA